MILSDDPIIQAHAFDSARYGLTPIHGMQALPPTRRPRPRACAGGSSSDAMRRDPPSATPRRPGRPGRHTHDAERGRGGADADRRALEMAGGNRTRASELLGISVRTLRNKLNTPSEGAEEDRRAERGRDCAGTSSFERAGGNYCRPQLRSRASGAIARHRATDRSVTGCRQTVTAIAPGAAAIRRARGTDVALVNGELSTIHMPIDFIGRTTRPIS